LALRKSGTLRQWGFNFGTPVTDSDITAIALGTNFGVALKSNGRVVAWGSNEVNQTIIPSGAQTNVVAIAAGGRHALAFRTDGTVVAWGCTNSGESTLPNGLNNGSNIMAIAAGYAFSVALKNDGTAVAWGDNTYHQTETQTGLTPIKLIAAGKDFTLSSTFNGL